MKAVAWAAGGVVVAPLALALALALAPGACGPSDKQRAEQAEKARIECLDKFCPGDVEPKRDMASEVALKLDGQWYIGPKEYFSARSGAVFYWPGKTPEKRLPDGKNYPEKGKPFHEVAIEIFLTGRQRWPEPNAPTPWDGGGWETRFDELQKQGLRIDRQPISPQLERVRFFEKQGKQYRHEFFLATQQRKIRGNGLPGIACDLYPEPRPKALPRCNGGMFWKEDVYADFRFHAQHATDWPAIHQQIVRVLNLARKVQP